MTKFKPGDLVRRTGSDRLGVKKGRVYTVSAVVGADMALEGIMGWYAAPFFELIPQEPAKDPHLPLTTVLEMDRVLAQASVKVDTLNEYLDKPLSDFIRDVMEPNYLSLKFGA